MKVNIKYDNGEWEWSSGDVIVVLNKGDGHLLPTFLLYLDIDNREIFFDLETGELHFNQLCELNLYDIMTDYEITEVIRFEDLVLRKRSDTDE